MPTILPGALPNIPFLWPGNYSPGSYSTKVNSSGTAKVKEYDYVIVGGGTAGCVLANRLSADPKTSVLVLEAGYSDSRQLFSRIPAGFSFLFQKDADFNYFTEPQPSLNNRRLFWPRGKMLGGCSSINALIYQRCSSTTYDDWAKENPGWDYASIEKYFDKAEGHSPHPKYTTEESHHGRDGPWKTSVASYTNPVSDAMVQASAGLGVPVLKDINNKETQLGGIRITTTVDPRGRRCSTAQAYLDDRIRARHNLTIGVGVTTTKIVFEGKKAVGVHFAKSKGGVVYQVKAKKEILVCTGSINTPQLLMISGVGPEAELKKNSIEVVHALPGVGQNLVDHLTTSGLLFHLKKHGLEHLKHEMKSGPDFMKWLLTGKGPMSSNLAEAAVFIRSIDVFDKEEERLLEPSAENTPDLELLMTPLNYIDHALNKVSLYVMLFSYLLLSLSPVCRLAHSTQ
jgi:choline dehydrogenase